MQPVENNDLLAVLAPPKPELASLHVSGFLDFVDPNRIGYVADRDRVAGFQSHRMTKMPQSDSLPDNRSSAWRIVRLELVSLLKNDVPVAYVSQNLPQMDELRDDNDIDVSGVRDVLASARTVYELFGAGDKLVEYYPKAEHSFPDDARRTAYEFLDKHLKKDE